MSFKPRIGITLGDPAGIGPEIIKKALRRRDIRSVCEPIVFGHAAALRATGFVLVEPNLVLTNRDVVKGKASAKLGYASGLYLEEAVQACKRGDIHAVVTAPINKNSFKLGGWGKRFVGHTEMLAALTKSRSVALMLVHGGLRAVHVTSHIPLKNVSSAVTADRVFETIRLTNDGLLKMGIKGPRIAVCGLNPHAGESGLLGKEEKTAIRPAVQSARKKKIRAEGPFSADTVWPMVRDGQYDAGVAMYHDQGQIPIKFSSFQLKNGIRQVMGVNVTLGLPIIRTSVAHGTAYEIAGKNLASEESLCDAIKMAAQMARRT